MEEQKKIISIQTFRKIFIKVFISLILIYEILFYPIILNAYDLTNIDNNLSDCKLKTNCILQNWVVDNSEKAFTEIIEILDNTPRVKIIEKNKYYIHALATSRIMKFVDDIEIKNLNKDNILQVKSSSRQGIYDLGVNKRRVQTLHFRLIDIYG